MTQFKQFFTDKNGRVVLFQWPNIFLLVWLIATIARKQTDVAWLGLVAFCSLVVWAILEIAYGASHFRRLLGAAVLAASVYARLKS
jgi:hypothetical protein